MNLYRCAPLVLALVGCGEAKTILDCPPDRLEPDDVFDIALTIEKGKDGEFDVVLDWSSGYDVIVTFLSVDGTDLEEETIDELDLMGLTEETYIVTATAPLCDPTFGPSAGGNINTCKGTLTARTTDLNPGIGESFSSASCDIEWNRPAEER